MTAPTQDFAITVLDAPIAVTGAGAATPALPVVGISTLVGIPGSQGPQGPPGTGGVASVFGRTGAVVATSGDYTASEVTGALVNTNNLDDVSNTATALGNLGGLSAALAAATYAPLNSPILTGAPTAPTQAPLSDNTDIATTAYVDGAVATQAVLGLPKSGGTMTGIITLDGVQYTLTLVNDVNYTPTVNDQIIVFTSLTTVRLVILTNLNVGQRLEIWDGTAFGSAGTNNINFSVGSPVKVNQITSGQLSAVTFPNGCATAVQTATNTWIAEPSPLPNLPLSAGQTTVTSEFKFTSPITCSVASSGAALTVTGGLELSNNNQTISSALTLNTASPVAQYLVASGGDQTVNLPFTGGCLFLIANVGSSNNLIVKYNSGGTTLCAIPPGGRVWIYCSNNSPFYQIFGSTNVQRGFVARSDLTVQAAAQSTVTLYTVPNTAVAQGQYAITYSAVITQAATTSCTLGGANGFQVTFTDNDTGASVTTLAGPTSSTNSVGTQVNGTIAVNAKVNTAIQFSFGYTSSGATAMQYALHIKAEFIG